MDHTFTIDLGPDIAEINEESWPQVKAKLKLELLTSLQLRQMPYHVKALTILGLDRHVESMKARLINQ